MARPEAGKTGLMASSAPSAVRCPSWAKTLSQVMRVNTEFVDGQDQGSVTPFARGLASGVMRPVFLPDGSLLLGQTGRGWGARGGSAATLQRIVHDGKTAAPFSAMPLSGKCLKAIARSAPSPNKGIARGLMRSRHAALAMSATLLGCGWKCRAKLEEHRRNHSLFPN